MELSIVSTIYNDAKTVELLVNEFINVVKPLKISFEIILVNDASLDNSEAVIKSICEKYSFVKGISLARNYGQQIAISAGIKYANGKYVLIIDGDLENPISSIPELYIKVKEGFDIVYTVSKLRQTFYKRITSELFWFVICKLLKIRIVKNQLLMRIMSRRMVDNYNTYGEISRSVAGINHDIGLNETKIQVTPKKRVAGSSNYNFTKRLNIFIDIVLNMSLRPLNFVIFFGFICFVFSIILSIYYLYIYITVGTLPGFISTIISIFFFGSSILFILGIISRYLSLIYLEVKNRPLFLIKEKYNL
jgi:glycosyltransferase involved in cell wall biosynthesis